MRILLVKMCKRTNVYEIQLRRRMFIVQFQLSTGSIICIKLDPLEMKGILVIAQEEYLSWFCPKILIVF
jgi:hypothetical protein